MLETLLKPFATVDEELQRAAVLVSSHFEKSTGLNKYVLAFIGNLPVAFSSLSPLPLTKVINGLGIADLILNMIGINDPEIYNMATGPVREYHPFIYMTHRVSSVLRMPMLFYGAACAFPGVVAIGKALASGEPIPADAYLPLNEAASALGLSASFYIKHSDPAALEKTSLFTHAADYLKSLVPSFTPQPEPVPVEGK